MKKIYPTELIDFLQCRHMTTLKKQGIQGEEVFSEEIELLREKGLEHEKEFLNSLEGEVVQIDPDMPLEEQKGQTLDAMQNGADFIYQACLENDRLAGYPDFLEKVNESSSLGDYSYVILDAKLANRPTPANAVQLIHYSEIMKEIQNKEVENLQIVHGDKTRTVIQKSDYFNYYQELLNEFEEFINGKEETEPFPIPYCSSCKYQKHCREFWKENDHLANIKNIKQSEIEKLHEADVQSISDLKDMNYKTGFSLSRNQFESLKQQLSSQLNNEISLKDSTSFYGLKQLVSGGILMTFFQNIQETEGAKVFHIGLKTFPGERFEEIFIMDGEGEKQAFQRITSFISRYLDKRPNSFVIVWSGAELKLIHDLSNKHNICHDEVDDLIFNKRLVPLLSLIDNALYVPTEKNDLNSFCGLFSSDGEKTSKLEKSPQILKELLFTGGVEEAKELISERARAELEGMEFVSKELCRYEIKSFPVKLPLEEYMDD